MVVPYAINIMSKHQPWLDHDAFVAKSLKGLGGTDRLAEIARATSRALSRADFFRQKGRITGG
jgi:hypothetical protein